MDPLVELSGSWRQGLAGRLLAGRLRAWAAEEPALRCFGGDPQSLFRFLRTATSREQDEVLCALLRQAKREQLAGMVVLEALLPGLKKLLGSILVEARQGDELLAVVLERAWAGIVGYPVDRRTRRVAANLLLDVRKPISREQKRRRLRGATSRLTGQEPAPDRGGDGELVVLQALAGGAIRREDAELILETRFGDRSLHELAAESGVGYRALLVRRIRAEKRLLLYLGRPVVTFRGSGGLMCTARSAAFEVAE